MTASASCRPRFRPTNGGVRRRWLTIAGAALFAAMLSLTGIGSGVERGLASLRMSLMSASASGQIVVVEVDAESLRRLAHWPWPRRYHASAVDRLAADGAGMIAFDVDFSAASTPEDDRTFADAMRRAGGTVILPTFRQAGSDRSDRWIDSVPIAPLRDAAFLAAVNIFPDRDGAVRSYPLGVQTEGNARPSIAAMLANHAGGDQRSFPIDYAIDPDTIPRISFIDLISHRVPGAALRGKHVLIGATAIELGDRYVVPRHGIIPGVLIQALAAETLIRHGVPIALGGVPAVLLCLLGIAAAAIVPRGRRARRMAFVAAALGLFVGAALAGNSGVQIEIVPALGLLLAVAGSRFAFKLLDELERRRFVDRESGLPNRSALERAAGARPDASVTVARLDRFNEMSTALGAAGGAQLIVQLAARAGTLLDTLIYRMEGGAIAWLSAPLDGDDDQHDHFAGLLAVLSPATQVDGARIDLRLTFGIAHRCGEDVGTRLAGALMAAQRARGSGAPWMRFMADDGQQERRQMALLGEFADALQTGAIWVAYQPKYGLRADRIIGAEALVRWRHPERGPISPDEFIPLLEAEGRACALTRHVLDTALADLSGWLGVQPDLAIAVNLSATLLQGPSLVQMIASALARHQVPPANLTLELTESAIIANTAVATNRLEELRAIGVKLSIDDYGTGQSTLSYLRQVPASELKIDKSFVRGIADNVNDRLLVRSTIELAHALNMTVVAEGVEDAVCLETLRALGCDVIQGWHTGRPMPAHDFDEVVRAPLSSRAAA